MKDGVDRYAKFSECGRYRYLLTRTWDIRPQRGYVAWIMLNPSSAGVVADDPTVRRCMGFAHRWGFGGIYVVNLFSRVSTDPAALFDIKRPICDGSTVIVDKYIKRAARHADRVICAWGGSDARQIAYRDRCVYKMLSANNVNLQCLGTTKAGAPKHPSRLAYSTPLAPFVHR